jgi:hypothetical protein
MEPTEREALKAYLVRRVKYAKKRLDETLERQGDKPALTHNYHGGHTAGYWAGVLTTYTDLLDNLENTERVDTLSATEI